MDDLQHPSVIRVHLKSSKTDPTRQDVDLFIGHTNNALAMLKYLVVHGFDEGPLFWCKDGSPLTHPQLVEKVKAALRMAGVDPTHYSRHSSRIGTGLNEATIQLLAERLLHEVCPAPS